MTTTSQCSIRPLLDGCLICAIAGEGSRTCVLKPRFASSPNRCLHTLRLIKRLLAADTAPEWNCGLSVPVGALVIALVGFGTACCWINAIANELLGLLQFFGVLWGISDMVRRRHAAPASLSCFTRPIALLSENPW